MKTTNLKEQVEKKQLLSDFYVDFHFKEEKKGKSILITDINLNHILFILEGEINISYKEFRNHLCKEGEMIFIPQEADTIIECLSEVKYLIMSFNNQLILHDDMGWNEIKEYDNNERDVFHKLDVRSPLNDVIESILYYKNHSITSDSLNEVKEKEIFLILKVFYSKQEVFRFLKPLLREDINFKTFVINNYTNAKNVEDLARLCHLSIRAFTRKFKVMFKDSPYRWILRQRSNQIRVLLASKKIPMQSIIQDYGFSSPAHFTTYCKKQFGATPSAFRNSLNGKKTESPTPKEGHVDASDTE